MTLTVRDTANHPPVGSFGLSLVGDTLGSLIHIGQALLGDSSIFGHSFMVTGRNEVVESRRWGAVAAPLDPYLDQPAGSVLFCDAPVQRYVEESVLSDPLRVMMLARADDEDGGLGDAAIRERALRLVRRRVQREARDLIGTPYNFLDYAALAAVQWAPRKATQRIFDRMQRNDRLICSQLVDLAYLNSGIHLFTDGRFPFQVTPGDLDRYHRTHPALKEN